MILSRSVAREAAGLPRNAIQVDREHGRSRDPDLAALGFEIVGRLPGAFQHAGPGFVDALVMFQLS